MHLARSTLFAAAVLAGSAWMNSVFASPSDEVAMQMADADLVLKNCSGLVVLNERNYLELKARWENLLVQTSDPIDRTSLLAGYELYQEKKALASDSRIEQMTYCVKQLIHLKFELGDKSPFTMK